MKINKKITAGPPEKQALPMVEKMPAPITAAMPKDVKSITVRFFLSESLEFDNSCTI